MVKTRLIPVLNILNGHIVRSEDFSIHQKIGNVVDEAKRYNEWKVDELIFLDISREKHYDLGRDDHKTTSYSTLSDILLLISDISFMPLTFGGGIRNMEQVDELIRGGADKITLNTMAVEDPGFVKKVAEKYGSQAVVVSVDYKGRGTEAEVFIGYGQKSAGVQVCKWVKELEKLGAGEVFLNSIDRDGKGTGYDLETIGMVVEGTRLPVVACGGAGTMEDFVTLAKHCKVSGIAAGNIFHFTERSYPKAKQLMKKSGIDVR